MQKIRVLKDWGTEKWTTVSLTGKRSVTQAPSCHPAFLAGGASWKNSMSGAGQGWGEGSAQEQGSWKAT